MKPPSDGKEDPSGAERRTEERLPLHVEVRFEEVSQAQRAMKTFTTNVSAGGLCLRTQHAYPIGHRLALTLTVEGHTFRLLGQVAWTRAEAVGVRFIEVGEKDRELLKRLMTA